MKILLEIRKLQKKLNNSIVKNGLNSNKTREISLKVDELINEYYKSIEIRQYPITSIIGNCYEVSYRELKFITLDNNKFPSVQEWNKYAKQNCLLSATAIQYVNMLDWNYIRAKIIRELNTKIL